MLNPKTNERELAYVVIVNDITPIEGYDRVELAHVGGWTIVVGKGEFKKLDPAIYFEIDSKLPEVKPFTDMEFLAKKKYRVKTQKMCKSISQGLLISAETMGWEIEEAQFAGGIKFIVDKDGCVHIPEDNETRFLTKDLGVTYYVAEDNTRKASFVDKYTKMAQRNGKLFSKQPFRWLMKRDWGKKLLFVFFGKKKDKTGWPAWVKKTDEERIQNMPWILEDKSPWIATEKIDGSSTTFTIKRGKWPRKNEFYVCSRNVCFDKPDKPCHYSTNIYLEMAEKYHMEYILTEMLTLYPEAEWITIQGETYGAGVQKRNYHLKNHDFMAFNLITSDKGRFNTLKMRELLEDYYHIPCVPIVDSKFILPDTVEELLDYATDTSQIDGGMREGIVFRSEDGSKSFKAVSNEFLLAFHG